MSLPTVAYNKSRFRTVKLHTKFGVVKVSLADDAGRSSDVVPDTDIDTDADKNELNIHVIMWCSYCTEVDINTDSDWVLY